MHSGGRGGVGAWCCCCFCSFRFSSACFCLWVLPCCFLCLVFCLLLVSDFALCLLVSAFWCVVLSLAPPSGRGFSFSPSFAAVLRSSRVGYKGLGPGPPKAECSSGVWGRAPGLLNGFVAGCSSRFRFSSAVAPGLFRVLFPSSVLCFLPVPAFCFGVFLRLPSRGVCSSSYRRGSGRGFLPLLRCCFCCGSFGLARWRCIRAWAWVGGGVALRVGDGPGPWGCAVFGAVCFRS